MKGIEEERLKGRLKGRLKEIERVRLKGWVCVFKRKLTYMEENNWIKYKIEVRERLKGECLTKCVN